MNDLHPNNILIYLPHPGAEESAWPPHLTEKELMERIREGEGV
jgi:hypothetical protein